MSTIEEIYQQKLNEKKFPYNLTELTVVPPNVQRNSLASVSRACSIFDEEPVWKKGYQTPGRWVVPDPRRFVQEGGEVFVIKNNADTEKRKLSEVGCRELRCNLGYLNDTRLRSARRLPQVIGTILKRNLLLYVIALCDNNMAGNDYFVILYSFPKTEKGKIKPVIRSSGIYVYAQCFVPIEITSMPSKDIFNLNLLGSAIAQRLRA